MIARTRMPVTLACLCALAGCLALATQGASAAVTHKYLSQITEVPASSGAGSPGPLDGVNAMAIDSGDLYVAEPATLSTSERLDEFNASSGAFVRQFALPSSLQAFYFFGLAAGHATGEEQVYAGAEDNEAKDSVTVFDGEGHVLGAPWSGADTPAGSFSPFGIGGIAADNSTSLGDWAAGDVYVSDRNNKVVDVFKPSAAGKEEYVTQIEGPESGVAFGEPSLVAVDQSNGDLVVVDNRNVVDIFEPTVLGKYALVRQVTGTPAGPFKAINVEQFGKSLAVDSSGDIYVAENEPTVVYQFSATGQYLGRLTGTPARPFHSAGGLAVDPETHEVYVGDALDEATEEPGAVDIFGPNLVVPDVATAPASNVKATSATIGGTVNPDNAGEATCQFVWGATTEFGNTAPCPAPIANGESPVPVQAALTGLSPDTTYYYRLQASNANGSNPGEPYQDDEVHTSGPGIHEEWSANVASSSATLNAKIDPNGSPTTYYFQYGTSNGYGSQVPAAPGASIGSASGDVTVSQHSQGLLASTTYHYRLVALSELPGGETVEFVGADQTFVTQPAAGGLGLPDGRAWELVSPPDKHGSMLETPMTEQGTATEASVNGDAVTYTANGPTEDAQQPGTRSPEPTQLFSRRGAGGWTTKSITTPYSEIGELFVATRSEYQLFSPDLSVATVRPWGETTLSSEATESTPYLRHNYVCETSPATCYTPLLTTGDVEPSGVKWAGPNNVETITATPDFSHVILQSSSVSLLPGGGSEQLGGTYEWSNGKLQLVSILPDGTPAPYGGAVGGGSSDNTRHALSDDGSRVVFLSTSGSGVSHLYMRDMVKQKTVQLDAVQPGAEGGQGQPVFQIASDDGSRVFFIDYSRLTTDSTDPNNGLQDLYEFDVETGKLKDISVPVNHGEHAAVQGVVQGASEDGSYVYFVADGVLAPGALPGHCPTPGATCNLYVRHGGLTTFIAALSSDDQRWENEQFQSDLEYVTARVSPNGRWFAFMSERSLTGYDNRDANSGEPDREVFLYDASTNRLRCASCNPTGAQPVGMFEPPTRPGPLVDRTTVEKEHWLAATLPGWPMMGIFRDVYQPRYLSDSGRLFFNSNEALVPQDVNGVMDVYEFEPEGEGDCTRQSVTFGEKSDGCVGLISSGGSAEESAFMDASANGNDVFFLTTARLRPEDFDSAFDMYDARVCTSSAPCFPVPAAGPPPCATGDACKPSPSPQPSVFGPAPSATFSGAGNVTPASTQVVAHRSLMSAQRFARALRACHRKRGKRERAACIRQAHKQYAGKPVGKKSRAPGAHGVFTSSGR
jgi:hypothetical protein